MTVPTHPDDWFTETALRDISVYAPTELTEEELTVGGPYVQATHTHLLMARGWTLHEKCMGTGVISSSERFQVMCNCARGLVPPERDIERLQDSLLIEHDILFDALVDLERIRMEEADYERMGVDGDLADLGGGLDPGVRGDDAAPGSASDEALEDEDGRPLADDQD